MTDNAMNPACKLCAHGMRIYPLGDVKGRVECRKDPRVPVCVSDDIRHVFPVMEDDDYCSHFKANKMTESISRKQKRAA